ncbi:6c63be29-f736-443a-b439-87d3f763647f [Sclerotinia trifoliorum]|uniref:6c63be29-f736-443a-b439-87d3f763647f n=1 Tax=Sclerotinia trifoliorum TaxID=28548 RepID=A0A8H2VZK6_9HELO|nr:6c63be29-f736-443a-b439-87d3f763647f [Sclerotinia trifoliorum]
MSTSSSSAETEISLTSDYERLNSITAEDSRTSESDDIKSANKGKGMSLGIQQTQSTPSFLRRERSSTLSMLMRRQTDGESVDSGPKSAGFFDKRSRFDGTRNRGKGGKKDGVKRRHSANEHTNVYTECGRHSDDWLFGGFSVSGAVKRIWQKDGKDSG